MLILAIESSCDETAAAVVENGRKALSNMIISQVDEHKLYGGVVPEIASRRHAESIVYVVRKALADANTSLDDIDAIAVTSSPGLIGALLVGVNFAKGLSLASGLPLIPVNHLRGHIAANYIEHEDLEPPFLCLLVSGGHSHIIEVEDYTRMRIIGRTRDDAAGEAFDKAARAMGLSYPGGVTMDKLAEKGNPDSFKLPHPKVDGSDYDFSFSGLKTAVINHIHKIEQKNAVLPIEDISASFRKAVVECLVSNFVSAAKNLNYNKLVVAGGVSANSLLRRELDSVCRENNWKLYKPALSLCTDNAAMIGSQAYYEFLKGNIAALNLNASAKSEI